MMNIHEEQFARNFIVTEKRERYLSMFDSKQGQKKLINGFYHLRASLKSQILWLKATNLIASGATRRLDEPAASSLKGTN